MSWHWLGPVRGRGAAPAGRCRTARVGIRRRGAVRLGRRELVEDARVVHDLRLLGMRERHLDDLDAEARRVGRVDRRQPSRSPQAPRRSARPPSRRRRRKRRPGRSGRERACACASRGRSGCPSTLRGCVDVRRCRRCARRTMRSALTRSETPCVPQSCGCPCSPTERKSRLPIDRRIALARGAEHGLRAAWGSPGRRCPTPGSR